MGNISGMGYSDGVMGLYGELFVANGRTPLLNAVGGLNAGKIVGNLTFSVGVDAALEAASQQALTEAASAAPVTPLTYAGTNLEQSIQIMRRDLSLSSLAQAAKGRVQVPEVSTLGYGFGDSTAAVTNLANLQTQIGLGLKQIALDADYSFICGTYVKSTGSTVASKMRGVSELCEDGASTDVDASADPLSKDYMYGLFSGVAAQGGEFIRPILLANSFQIKALNTLYGYAPPDRNVGGVNVSTIWTQWGAFGIMWDPQVPADEVILVDMAYLAPAFLPTASGNKIEVVSLAKTAAADSAMLLTFISLDHGPARMHGKISNLSVA